MAGVPAVAAEAREEPRVQVIRPPRGVRMPEFGELWHYRDLLALLVKRDVAVRYRQTAVGGLWAVIQPLGLATVFSVFLGKLAKVPSQGDIPYPVYAFSGMVMWLYLSSALSRCSESTVASGPLISKVYFPRLLIPIAAVIPPAVDFVVAFVVLLAVMLAYGEIPAVQTLMVPAALFLAMATSLAFGLWFSAVAVRFRDVHHLVPFLLTVALFCTPIVYPFSLVPENLQPLYALNPAVGVIEIYRWMLFGEMSAPAWIVLIPVTASVSLLVTGALWFSRAERAFADLL
jgi:lipopolysaccharide transport system permease protein